MAPASSAWPGKRSKRFPPPWVAATRSCPCHASNSLTRAAIARLARQYLDRLAVLAGGEAARVTDKMPDNYMYLGLLAALFPRATFIHCRRDLRDVAVSCWMTDFRSMLWANDKATIASRFHQYERLMDHWRAVLPVANSRSRLRGDGQRSGVGRAAAGGSVRPRVGPGLSSTAPEQEESADREPRASSAPVYRDSLGRWKHYETELADLFGAIPESWDPGVAQAPRRLVRL